MEQQNNDLTQEDLNTLLKAYLARKGALTHQEAEAEGWLARHENVYKEFCHFALGVTPPILVPTSEDTLPVQIVEDPLWLELLGMEPASEDINADETPPGDSGPSADSGSSKINVAENGDLSFVMKTGVHQQRVPTEDENLATEVVTKTNTVADELVDGSPVTAESVAADKAQAEKEVFDEESEDHGATKTAAELNSEDDTDDEVEETGPIDGGFKGSPDIDELDELGDK